MTRFSTQSSESGGTFHGPIATHGDLELPDAPDFRSHRSRLSLEEMLPLMEQWRQWFPKAAITQEQRLRGKCHVEFVL
jgi:hypothetical protein